METSRSLRCRLKSLASELRRAKRRARGDLSLGAVRPETVRSIADTAAVLRRLEGDDESTVLQRFFTMAKSEYENAGGRYHGRTRSTSLSRPPAVRHMVGDMEEWLHAVGGRAQHAEPSASVKERDPSAPSTLSTAQHRAQSFRAEHRLREWVRRQNEKGLTPSGRATFEAYQRMQTPEEGAPREPSATRSRSYRSSVQWIRRWYRRHGLIKGQFKAGSALSLKAMRDKV